MSMSAAKISVIDSGLAPEVSKESDVLHLWSSLNERQPHEEPYQHYILDNLFDPQLIDDILTIPFIPHDLDYTAGTREQFNPVRRYINPETMEAYPATQRVADAFLDKRVIEKLESMEGVCLKDSLLRIECCIDADKFWLKPHTDLGVKLVTILLYLSKDEEASTWGTDIYADADHYHSTAPYKSNRALLFFPTDKTWHGFEPRTIHGIRKSLIINFVTQEWRNRQELVHPSKVVY